MTNKKNISNVDPEFGVDSRYKTNNEREQESIALMQARLDRMKNLSNEQILRAKLLQSTVVEFINKEQDAQKEGKRTILDNFYNLSTVYFF